MGFVDRGGGREAKGSSLRRSKKNPGAPSTRNKDAHKNYATATVRTCPTAPLALQPAMNAWIARWMKAGSDNNNNSPADVERGLVALADAIAAGSTAPSHCFVDGAVALLSRKLEADQEGILRRAQEDGRLAAMICWCTEMDRQTLLLETCKNHNQMAVKDRTAMSRRGKGTAATGQQQQQQQPAKSAKGGSKKVHFAGEDNSAEVVAPADAVDVSSEKKKKDAESAKAGAAAAAAGVVEEDNGCIMYSVVGVHVNNIDRTNKKAQEQWLEDVSEKAKHPEVVGVLSGLNLSRDAGTHYAQEHLLKEMWRVAGEEKLPLVLHVYANDAASTTQTADRLAELLQELYAQLRSGEVEKAPVAIVLYNGLRLLSHSKSLQQLVRARRPSLGEVFPSQASHGNNNNNEPSVFVMTSADGLTASAEGSAEKCSIEPALVSLLPSLAGTSEDSTMESPAVALSQLLLSTGAPWATPQNMDDPYVCTLPNEPGNFLFTAKAVYDAMVSRGPAAKSAGADATLSQEVVMRVALLNTVKVFFADCLHQQLEKAHKVEAKKAQAAATAAAQATAEAAAAQSSDDNDDDASDASGESDGEHEAGVPRVHVPVGVALVEAPAAPAVTDEESLAVLLREAAEERERLARQAEADEEAAKQRAEEDAGRKKKEKKKNVKKNNRSNFSTFRNKDFAARTGKKGGQESDDDAQEDGGHNRPNAGSDVESHSSSRSSSSHDADRQAGQPQRAAGGKKGARANKHADPAAKTPPPAASSKAAKGPKPVETDSESSDSDNEAVTTMAPRKARKKKNKKFQKQMAQYQQAKGSGDDDSSDDE